MDGFYGALNHGVMYTCQYLQNHMQQGGQILQDLNQWTVQLQDPLSYRQGIKIQLLSTGQQRVVFSAIMYHAYRFPPQSLYSLVDSYLKHQPNDPYCVRLCHMVIRQLKMDIPIHEPMNLLQPVNNCFEEPDEIATPKLKRKRSVEIDTDSNRTRKKGPIPQLELVDQVRERAIELNSQLKALSTHQVLVDGNPVVIATLELLLTVSSDNPLKTKLLCKALGLETQSDEAIFAVFKKIIDSNPSLQQSVSLTNGVLYPKLLQLETSASRMLLNGIIYGAKSNPECIIQGLLEPLLTINTVLNVAQCEIVTRLMRQDGLQREKVARIFELVVASRQKDTSLLCDQSITILQQIINNKIELRNDSIVGLIEIMDGAISQTGIQTSVKFATMLFHLVSKYGPQCQPQASTLHHIASQCSSFIGKSAVRAVSKLQRQ